MFSQCIKQVRKKGTNRKKCGSLCCAASIENSSFKKQAAVGRWDMNKTCAFPPFGDLHKHVPAPRAYAKWSKLPHLCSQHKVKHCFLSISVEDPAKNNQIIYSGQNGFLKLVICPKGLWSNGGSSCVKREWVFMASGMNYLWIGDLGPLQSFRQECQLQFASSYFLPHH